jgi:pilus assembly protein Flp/PilA
VNELRAAPARTRALVAHPLRCRVAVAACAAHFINQRRCRTFAPYRAVHNPGEGFMSMLLNYVKMFARDEEGQDLLEYALLVALIALIAIGAVGAAGGSVKTIFNNIATQLTNPS